MSFLQWIKSLFGLDRQNRLAACRPVYAALVAQARHPALYGAGGAEDSFAGRFDVLVLHLCLYLRRLKSGKGLPPDMAQAIFDLFFGDMDQAIREMGVGDLSVGKKIKKMVAAFYGRAAAYDAAFSGDNPQAALADVIRRNLALGSVIGKDSAAEKSAASESAAEKDSVGADKEKSASASTSISAADDFAVYVLALDGYFANLPDDALLRPDLLRGFQPLFPGKTA